MKRQGIVMTRVIMLLLFLGIVVYFGFYVYDAIYDPFKTAYTVDYNAEEYVTSTGYVVRDEQIITAEGELIKLEKSEGEKVGMGQALATSYSDSETLQKAERIEKIEITLEQLNSISISAENITGISKLDDEIKNYVIDMAFAAANGEAENLKSDSTELSSLILIRNGTYSGSNSVETLKTSLSNELEELQSTLHAGEETVILAEKTGVFSAVCDGYETLLYPEMLDTVTTESLKDMEKQAVLSEENAIGKLIFGVKWYYVTSIDSEYAELFREENSIKMRFSGGYTDELTMKVERVGTDDEDGNCVLVLSCDEAINEITTLRLQTADLIYSEYSGLKIQKEAVRIDEDGVAGVYVIEGLQAEFKPVTVLHEFEDYLIVKKETEGSSRLLVGEEIIVKAKDLFDGKVVR